MRPFLDEIDRSDDNFEFNLGTAKNDIRKWQTWYMRKNSKYSSKIMVRCNSMAPEIIFWTYFMELWINGKMTIQYRIKPEAYDTFDLDKSLRREAYTGIEIIILKEFTPASRTSIAPSAN